MKAAGKIMLGLLAVGAGIAGVAALSKSSGPSPSPSKAALGGATVFGDVATANLPADFNGDGNDIHFNADCSTVVVGAQFVASASSCVSSWDPSRSRRDPTELVSVRDALHDGESLCAFIDHLMHREEITDAQKILHAIVVGLDPPCIGRPSGTWPKAMREFVNWLGIRVNAFVMDVGGTNPNPEVIL